MVAIIIAIESLYNVNQKVCMYTEPQLGNFDLFNIAKENFKKLMFPTNIHGDISCRRLRLQMEMIFIL